MFKRKCCAEPSAERQVEAAGQQVLLPFREKAGSTLRFRRLEVGQAWSGFSDRPAYSDAQTIAHEVSEAYTNGEVDRVVIVYNAFVSPLVQKVTVRDVLPIPQDLLERSEDDQPAEQTGDARLHLRARAGGDPRTARARVRRDGALPGAPRVGGLRAGRPHDGDAERLEGGRELIDSLTLAMNRARQAEITQEILEVVAGADALSG